MSAGSDLIRSLRTGRLVGRTGTVNIRSALTARDELSPAQRRDHATLNAALREGKKIKGTAHQNKPLARSAPPEDPAAAAVRKAREEIALLRESAAQSHREAEAARE